MKKVIFILVLGAVGFVGFSYFYQENPEDAVWIHGTWGLAYDPDGNDKDFMHFNSQGQVELKSSPRKTYATCEYASKIGHVTITCLVKGAERKIALEVSPGNDRLTNESGAYYSKM